MPVSENSLIDRIRRRAKPKTAVVLGIGDDCAIVRIPDSHDSLLTTDFTLEGIHFRQEWHPPEAVGHRCLTRGLSDIAAMGGQPIAAFLSLALPRKIPHSWVDWFMQGFLQLADRFNVTLAGGDTAESPAGILADIVVLGSTPRGTAIRRSEARPGDGIYVTGALGGSAATLQRLRSGKKLRPADFPAHYHPVPRLEVGRYLREKRFASAMIDISDGLSTDLSHICDESDVGAEINSEAIPLAGIGKPLRQVNAKFALHGGEDYELLFTAPARVNVPAQIAGVTITKIGRVTRTKRLYLIQNNKKTILRPEGWQHFAAKR